MEKKYYLIKLIGPRQNFALTITDSEKNLMMEHGKYWQDIIKAGHVVIFGPVFDANDQWGIVIVETEDGSKPKEWIEGDPTIKSNTGFSYTISQIKAGFVRK